MQYLYVWSSLHTEIRLHVNALTNVHTQTKVHSGINHWERTI